jgi:GT2 family glycosyltransferase
MSTGNRCFTKPRKYQLAPITVLILSWNRPLYLWACLDSLFRYTRRPARFILIDNHSSDPRVDDVIDAFEKRGMFHRVVRTGSNSWETVHQLINEYGSSAGEYFAFVESDVVVFDTDPCWLSRLCAVMDAQADLGMLGSYVDGRDFIDAETARRLAPDMPPDRLAFLIKENSPERRLPLTPPAEPVIEPFNPPGRLLMLRSSVLEHVSEPWEDWSLYLRLKEVGIAAGIATGVRHRHLSLLNLFDYPDYGAP